MINWRHTANVELNKLGQSLTSPQFAHGAKKQIYLLKKPSTKHKRSTVFFYYTIAQKLLNCKKSKKIELIKETETEKNLAFQTND